MKFALRRYSRFFYIASLLLTSVAMGCASSSQYTPPPTVAPSLPPTAAPTFAPAPATTIPATTAAPPATLPKPSPAVTPKPPVATVTGAGLAAQVEAGRSIYSQKGAGCHGGAGEGKAAPAIIGPKQNLSNYENAQKLFNFVSQAMPANAPGSLSQQDYLNVLAFLLQSNGYLKEGAPALTMDVLSGISLTK